MLLDVGAALPSVFSANQDPHLAQYAETGALRADEFDVAAMEDTVVAGAEALRDSRQVEARWRIIPNRVAVGLRTRTRIGDVGAYAETLAWPTTIGPVTAANVNEVYTIPKGQGTYLTVVTIRLQTELDVRDAVRELQDSGVVEFAETTGVFLGTSRDTVPDDPYYDDDGQYYHAVIETPQAWDTFQQQGPPQWGGDGVIVAVVDTGLDLDHPDLVDNIWDPDPVNNNHLDDHGTHIAGIIAAVTDNGIGIPGIAGDAQIMALNGAPDIEMRAAKFVYATDNGAKIVNCSYGGFPTENQEPAFTLYREAVDYMYRNGVLHVNSAGNEGNPAPNRQNYHQTLNVAATTHSDEKWVSSEYGSNWGTGIDISAPGRDIFSTSSLPDGQPTYTTKTGTSMAAPMVAGVAALIWSQHPEWTRDQVVAQLLGRADDIDQVNWGFLGSSGERGLDGMMGTGRVNANRAVNGPLAPPRIEGIREVPDVVHLGTTSLTVDLANVYLGPTFDEFGVLTATSPVDDLDNWSLVYAGLDGIFGEDDPGGPGGTDDEDVALTLTYDDSEDYTGIYQGYEGYGYLIGTNDLTFTLDQSKQFSDFGPGRYRFKAFAYDEVTAPNGLRDPFGTALDGDGDAAAGDDYVRTFYVGAGINLAINADYPSSPGAAGDGQPDTFLITPNSLYRDYVDVWVNDALVESRPMSEVHDITIDGSTDDDTVTVDHLKYGADVHGAIYAEARGGNDLAVLHGGNGEDTFRGEEYDAELTTAGLVVSVSEFDRVEADTGAGRGVAYLEHGLGDAGSVEAEEDWAKLTYATDPAEWSTRVAGFETVYVLSSEEHQAQIKAPLETNVFYVKPDVPDVVYFWDKYHIWDSNDNNDWKGWVADLPEYTFWLDAYGNTVNKPKFPDTNTEDAVINGGRATIPDEQMAIRHLILVGAEVVDEMGLDVQADLALAGGATLTTADLLEIENLTLGVGGGTVDPLDAIIVAETLSAFDGDATLNVDGDFRFDSGTGAVYAARLHRESSNRIHASGDVVLADSEFTAEAHKYTGTKLWPDLWGDRDRTIVSAGGTLDGGFANGPPPYDPQNPQNPENYKDSHLGYGIFHRETSDYANSVVLSLIQAGPGDAEANYLFNFADLTIIFTASGAVYGNPNPDPPVVWTGGDFNGDGAFMFDDLTLAFAELGAFYGGGPYWPQGAGAGGGGEGAAAAPTGGQQVRAPVTLVYDAATGRLRLDAGAEKLRTVLIESAAGLLAATSESAELTAGTADVSKATRIGKAGLKQAFGDLDFGALLPAMLDPHALAKDLTVTGAYDGGGYLGQVRLVYLSKRSEELLTAAAADARSEPAVDMLLTTCA